MLSDLRHGTWYFLFAALLLICVLLRQPSELDDSNRVCHIKSGITATFCRAQTHGALAARFVSYSYIKQRCKWQNRVAKSHIFVEEGFGVRVPSKTMSSVQVCGIKDKFDQWSMVKVGPFYSSGGNTSIMGGTAGITIHLTNPLQLDVNNGAVKEAISIVSLLHMPVDNESVPLSWPPVRIHHSVIADYPLPDDHRATRLAPVAFNSDYPCKGQASVLCYLRDFPDGFSYSFSREDLMQMSTWTTLVDARSPLSPELEYYFEYTHRFRVNDRSIHLSVLEVWSPIEAFRTPHLSLESYWLPPGQASMMWFSTTMPMEGSLAYVDYHTHHLNDAEVYVFASELIHLGLNVGSFKTNISAMPLILDQMSAQQATRSIFSHLNAYSGDAAPPQLVCRGADRGIERVKSAHMPGVEPGLYGRETQIQCSDWKFSRDDPISFVFINAARLIQAEGYHFDVDAGGSFFNHHVLGVAYSAPRTTVSEYKFVIGGHFDSRTVSTPPFPIRDPVGMRVHETNASYSLFLPEGKLQKRSRYAPPPSG